MALSYAVSQKLALVIEKCLQFLNALSFDSENKVMFLTRHSSEINNPVIVSNSVEVVNVPSLWKWFIISLLPYKYVFRNISRLACSRMVGAFYSYISVVVISATFPRIMSFAPSVFPMTTSTSCRFISRKSFATINAGWMSLSLRVFSHCIQSFLVKCLALFRVIPCLFSFPIFLAKTIGACSPRWFFRTKAHLTFSANYIIHHTIQYTPSRQVCQIQVRGDIC